MNSLTVITLNYIQNNITPKEVAAFVQPFDYRDWLVDRMPVASLGGVWYNLVKESLDYIDWFAIYHFLNNKANK